MVRHEDDRRVPPDDTQCIAAVGKKGNRCKKKIAYDDLSDAWSTLCEKHSKQNNAARVNEATKVKLFVGKE